MRRFFGAVVLVVVVAVDGGDDDDDGVGQARWVARTTTRTTSRSRPGGRLGIFQHFCSIFSIVSSRFPAFSAFVKHFVACL